MRLKNGESLEAMQGVWVQRQFHVNTVHTASNLKSGRVDVLGTPELVRFVEEIACGLLDDRLAESDLSLGEHMSTDHIAPTPVGHPVFVWVEVAAVKGHRVTFAFKATDAAADGTIEKIAHGTQRRYVGPRQSFQERVRKKRGIT